jgi:hypothetical protein
MWFGSAFGTGPLIVLVERRDVQQLSTGLDATPKMKESSGWLGIMRGHAA